MTWEWLVRTGCLLVIEEGNRANRNKKKGKAPNLSLH